MRLAKTGFFRKAPSPHISIKQELLLHRSVLDKALIDSFSHDENIRLEVEDWLELTNPDFVEACERAMLEPDGVFETFHLFKKLLRGKNARFQKFGEKKQSGS